MPIRCVAGFEKFGSSGRAIPAQPEQCALVEASRHAISKQYVKKRFASPFSGAESVWIDSQRTDQR
jgi:hypothetical protein